MRAIAVTLLAALAFALPQHASAQDSASPNKPSLGSGRVNSLSPDEARRAERSRARAAGTKSAPDAAKTPPEPKKETVREEKAAPRPEPTREAVSHPQRPRSTARIERPRPVQIVKERSSKHYARSREREPQQTAVDRDRHRSRVTERAPRERRRYVREWTPRVGGVVPPYVRLYRMPPGYYPGPAYVTRAYPAPVYAGPAYEEPGWHAPFFMPRFSPPPTTEVDEPD